MKKIISIILVSVIALMLLTACGKKTPVEIAESYIGREVSGLIDEIGAPVNTDYQTSCEKPNAKDGFLDYDGFTVVTVLDESGEIVQRVDK